MPTSGSIWTRSRTESTCGAFLEALADDRLAVARHRLTGLATGKAVSLIWSDVDLDAGTARVAGTKGERADRMISLDSGTVEVLRAHRVRQVEEHMAWGAAWTDTGRLFARDDGTDLHPNVVSDRFDPLVVLTKIPPIRLRDARHGGDPSAAAGGIRPCGHADPRPLAQISLTLGTYSHVVPELAQEAADRIERALWAP